MSEPHPVKPVARADRRGAEAAAAGEGAARTWWRRVPRVVTAPRSVFAALAVTEDADVDARSEPILAISILAGIAGVLLAPASFMDDPSVDALTAIVITFISGVFYGAAGYFLLGLALWLGAKAVGVDVPFRIARHVLGFAALPLALSLIVLVPAIVIGFGPDWFRSWDGDEGRGHDLVVGVGLAFAVWSLALVVVGLRTTFRLPWRGVVGALALAGVLVAALVVLPTTL